VPASRTAASRVAGRSSSRTLGRARRLPPGERRLVAAAFLSLFGILCAQAVLETARDALFLTHLPAARLPWVYLGMAGLTLLAVRASLAGHRRGPSRSVSLSMLLGGAATAGLWVWLADVRPASVYALFLWTGVFAAWTVTQVWGALAEVLDMSLAKRLYGLLAAGGGLGAVVGSAAARIVSAALGPRPLVLLAGAAMAVTAVPALALRRPSPADAEAPAGAPEQSRGFLRLAAEPYVGRLLATALLAAAVSTIVDVSFKEMVAARLPAAQLASFFASFHLVANAVSLVVQLLVVGAVIRAIGVGRAHLIFPLLLLVGVSGAVLTGGLMALVLVRGLDAALRNSFQRPAFELLQVPLRDDLRRRAKPLIDILGQRGGQALASVALLIMLQASLGPQSRLAVAAALLIAWVLVAVGLKGPYVDRLRSALLRPARGQALSPLTGLDEDTRAALAVALASPDEVDVTAALALVAIHGRPDLIPARLLEHPSAAVVVQALALIRPDGAHEDIVPTLDRLLDHPDIAVRTMALRRRAALMPDRAMLTALAQRSTCPAVQVTARVFSIAHGWTPDGDGEDPSVRLLALARDASPSSLPARQAAAEAIADIPLRRFEDVLVALARSAEKEVLSPLTTAMAGVAADSPVVLACLIAFLRERPVRAAARAALVKAHERGGPVFEALVSTLADLGQPVGVRANIPLALVELDLDSAAGPLLDGLLVEHDGFVRFRILRALNHARRVKPTLTLDEDILGRAATAAVDSAYRYLEWRLELEAGADRRGARRTATWHLLDQLLREKEDNAVERLFRVLELRYPGERFRRLLATVRAGDRRSRAAGRELIENLLTEPARGLTLALVDELADSERLARLTAGHPPRAHTYRTLLETIQAQERGGTLAALAAHHAAEVIPTQPEAELA
jgi:AAA family ATP:ADP antiporter